MTADIIDRHVISWERNVVRVNFACEPEPLPDLPFPGAGAMRASTWNWLPVNVFSASIKAEGA